MANFILEKETLRELMGSKHSYAVVLTGVIASKYSCITGTYGTYDGGTNESLRANHVLGEVNLITKTVEPDKSGSANPGSRKV